MPSRRCLTEENETVWRNPDRDWLGRWAGDEFMRWTIGPDGSARILRRYYSANNPSDACPFGLGDEDAIVDIFHEEA